MRQRKRHPLDVPTPVAVALADFCRRAGAAVDPRTVRDALSALEAVRDDEVIALCAKPPNAKPLGPFAVIDMLENGTTAFDAAELQLRGEWDDVRLDDAPAPEPVEAVGETESVEAGAPEPEPDAAVETTPGRRRRVAKPDVAARIAPVHRRKGEPLPLARTPAPRAPPRFAPFKKRELPRGRGRFTRVDLTKLKVEALLKPHLKEELEALIRQHGHRFALTQALAAQYQGKKGEALTVADIEAALLHHRLRQAIAERERTLVVAAVTEVRGDLHRAALQLGMKDDELDHVILNAGAAAEVARVREHHAREALAHGNLRLKIELLERPKYLADLGVEKRFREALTLELTEQLERVLPLAQDVDGLVHVLSRREGLPYEKLKAAVDQTGLWAQYRRRLAS